MDEDSGGRLVVAAQEAAAKAIKAAGQAAVAMMYGLVALMAGTAAAIMAGLAITGKLTGEMLTHLSQSIRDAIPAAVAAAPALLQTLSLAGALVAALWAWLRLHQAYGGDWLATIPASVFAFAPLLTFYTEHQTAGRAVIAAGLAGLIGWVVGYVPLWLLGCITAAIYAWLITHIGREPEHTGDNHEAQFSDRGDRRAVDFL